jgi:hypothetical protein
MSAEMLSTFYAVGYAQSVAQSMDNNKVDVLVLTQSQYMSILQDKAKTDPRLEANLRKILSTSAFGQYWSQTFNPNASEAWVVPAALGTNDLIVITKTLNAIGMAGITSYVKATPSGTYIIIKGYAANRSSALQGTRYLATNPKMLQLGLGMKSVQGVAKGGFILGVVVSSGIEITDFILNDEKTMYDLAGGIGVEAVKCGLGALVAYAAAAFVGTAVTTVAIVPLAVMAVVAVVAGIGLNALDNHFGIKGKVIAALKALPEKAEQGIYYIDEKSTSWMEEIGDAVKKKQVEMGRAMDQGMREWLCRISCRRY